jgi:hypothetical protein
MNKYISRVTSSARGETFNPLIYPALISTLIYGIGFTFFSWEGSIAHSSLFAAMTLISPIAPVIWGAIAILTIVVGFIFLLLNKPPAGKFSGLVGFMLWTFACACWILTGGTFLAVGLPNLWFWMWQFLTLSRFRAEEKSDAIDYYAEHGHVDRDL